MSKRELLDRNIDTERVRGEETQNERYARQGRKQINCHIQIGLWRRLKDMSEVSGIKIWKLLSVAILEAVEVWEKDGVSFRPLRREHEEANNNEG